MANNPLVFQFHNIAEAIVSSESPLVRGFFLAEYGYHQVEKPSEHLPKVSLTFHLKNSSQENFTQHTHKLLARWNYNISIHPAEINLNVFGNTAAISMVHHMLLHPSLRWLSANSGTLLLHAGAVSKNNRSLIFTGKGGAGKTTTTSLILASERGWKIHADDYVFLDDQQSKAYVTRSHLYRDLQHWVPGIRTRLTPWERTRLEFFGVLRKYSREGIKWPVRLSPERLWPGVEIAETAMPAGILLLERADIARPTIEEVKSLSETTEDLLNMNFSEARHFLTLLKKAGALDDSWLTAWKEQERDLIHHLLNRHPTFRLTLPFSQNTGNAQTDLLALLEELVR